MSHEATESEYSSNIPSKDEFSVHTDASGESLNTEPPAKKDIGSKHQDTGEQDLRKLGNALRKAVTKQLDTSKHAPVLFERQGREKAVEKEKYERKLSQAVREERLALLTKGHVIPAATTSPLETKLQNTAISGVLAFMEAIQANHDTLASEKQKEKEHMAEIKHRQELMRNSERTTWKTLDKDYDMLDEFIKHDMD